MNGVELRLHEGAFVRLVAEHPARFGRMNAVVRAVSKNPLGTERSARTVSARAASCSTRCRGADRTSTAPASRRWNSKGFPSGEVVATRHPVAEDAPLDRIREVRFVFGDL